MRNILALLAAGLLAFGGLGWYLGWYHVQSEPSSDGHRQIKIDVDTKKITEDVGKEIKQGAQKIEQIIHSTGSQPQTIVPLPQPERPTSVAPNRFRLEGGVLVDTEGVSVPVPIK